MLQSVAARLYPPCGSQRRVPFQHGQRAGGQSRALAPVDLLALQERVPPPACALLVLLECIINAREGKARSGAKAPAPAFGCKEADSALGFMVRACIEIRLVLLPFYPALRQPTCSANSERISGVGLLAAISKPPFGSVSVGNKNSSSFVCLLEFVTTRPIANRVSTPADFPGA